MHSVRATASVQSNSRRTPGGSGFTAMGLAHQRACRRSAAQTARDAKARRSPRARGLPCRCSNAGLRVTRLVASSSSRRERRERRRVTRLAGNSSTGRQSSAHRRPPCLSVTGGLCAAALLRTCMGKAHCGDVDTHNEGCVHCGCDTTVRAPPLDGRSRPHTVYWSAELQQQPGERGRNTNSGEFRAVEPAAVLGRWQSGGQRLESALVDQIRQRVQLRRQRPVEVRQHVHEGLHVA